MQKIKLGQQNRIYLKTKKRVDGGTLTLVDERGNAIKKQDGTAIVTESLTSDADGIYYEFTPHADSVAGWWRAFWVGTYNGINIPLEGALDPEDIEAIAVSIAGEQLVPPSFFESQYLRGIDFDLIKQYFTQSGDLDGNRTLQDCYRDALENAREELELDTGVFFTPRKRVERYDYTGEDIMETKWFMQLEKTPVLELKELSLWFQGHKVSDQEIPLDWIDIGNPNEHRLTVLPFSQGQQGLTIAVYSVFYTGLRDLLGKHSYIPDFFRVVYMAGLDWYGEYATKLASGDADDSAMVQLTSQEKKNVMSAIARRAAINLLPNLDVARGIASQSTSVDGRSSSTSRTSSAMYGENSAAILNYQEQEEKWMDRFMARYNTRFVMG